MSHSAHIDDFVPCKVCGNCLTCDPHGTDRCVGKFDFEMYRTAEGVITTRPKAVSKPETPCLPGCRWTDGPGPARYIHAEACGDAPKAEAPPAPKAERISIRKVAERLLAHIDNPAPPAPKPYETTLGGFPVTVTPAADFDPTLEVPPAPVSGRTLTLQTQTPGGQPAPVSEPPIDWDDALKFAQVFKQQEKGEPSGQANACRAFLALKAQNATLTAELSDLKQGIPLTYNPNAMCRTGHEMVLFKNGDEKSPLGYCPMCDMKAEVERLRDLILDIADGQEDGIVEAMSIRAAREAGKA